MTDLTSLIEKLEKAEGPSRDLDVEIMNTLAPRSPDEKRLFDGKVYPATWGAVGQVCDHIRYFVEAPFLTSSIDAAVALAERVLPGWGWGIESNTHHIKACLNPEYGEPVCQHPHWAAVSNTSGRQFEDAASPAIALVLATLRALQQKGSSNA